jgi:hypothetical protein
MQPLTARAGPMTGRATPGSEGARAFTWPLWEHPQHLELGHILNSAVSDALDPGHVGALGIHHAGLWECDLQDNSLIWSGGSYDIFGLRRGLPITRELSLAHYCEHSRATLEALRSTAISGRRGFTVDVEIRAAIVGERRWVRVIGAPVCDGDRVSHLHGIKLII